MHSIRASFRQKAADIGGRGSSANDKVAGDFAPIGRNAVAADKAQAQIVGRPVLDRLHRYHKGVGRLGRDRRPWPSVINRAEPNLDAIGLIDGVGGERIETDQNARAGS